MVLYKLVILGASSVGKSSIVEHFVHGNGKLTESTLVASYSTLYVEDFVKFATWEVAGFERWHNLAHLYYKDAQAALIVYDVRDTDTLIIAKNWIRELRKNLSQDLVIALAGNKMDLWESWCIDSDEVKDYARQQGLIFMETSVRTGQNIKDIFGAIAEQLKQKGNSIHRSESIKKSRCGCVIL